MHIRRRPLFLVLLLAGVFFAVAALLLALLPRTSSCKMNAFLDVVSLTRVSLQSTDTEICIDDECTRSNREPLQDESKEGPLGVGAIAFGPLQHGKPVAVELRLNGRVVDTLEARPVTEKTPRPPRSCQDTFDTIGLAIDGDQVSQVP